MAVDKRKPPLPPVPAATWTATPNMLIPTLGEYEPWLPTGYDRNRGGHYMVTTFTEVPILRENVMRRSVATETPFSSRIPRLTMSDDPFAPIGRVPLPHHACNTLYVEGLPKDISKNEVAHIFRPFAGYIKTRLVTEESKHVGWDPVLLCFVDFANAFDAAAAMNALQGYIMDEEDANSEYLTISFAPHPAPK